MENKNWPDEVRLKMIEKSEFYPDDKQVYQYGFYDGFQYAMQAYHEARLKEITDADIEAAAKEFQPDTIRSFDCGMYSGYIFGAQAALNNEIKHNDK
jgi:hypothetical protein